MFANDLALGHKYEDIFVEKYLGSPEGLDRPAGNFSGYDFSHNGVRYEIKCDRRCTATGNFCIEAQCNGVPSGISTTQAHYYGYFVILPDGGYHLYKIPTVEIMQMIVDKKYSKGMKGGDGWRSYFYLFPKELFSQYQVHATGGSLGTTTDSCSGSMDSEGATQ